MRDFWKNERFLKKMRDFSEFLWDIYCLIFCHSFPITWYLNTPINQFRIQSLLTDNPHPHGKFSFFQGWNWWENTMRTEEITWQVLIVDDTCAAQLPHSIWQALHWSSKNIARGLGPSGRGGTALWRRGKRSLQYGPHPWKGNPGSGGGGEANYSDNNTTSKSGMVILVLKK